MSILSSLAYIIRTLLLFFFFFQAEDGIRDVAVTGVQTCALPISLAAWSEANAPAGDKKDAAPARHWVESWSIPEPDLVLSMPQAVSLPANGDVPYTYEVVPTGFAEDRWVQMSDVLPSLRSNVHHAVVYIRDRKSVV